MPKAALLEHGGLSQLVQAQTNLFQVDAVSRMLQFSSLSFDAATAEIGVALAAGEACSLVVVERWAPRSYGMTAEKRNWSPPCGPT